MRFGNRGFDFQGVNNPRFRADIFLERTQQRGIWVGTGENTSELTLKSYSDLKIGDLILTSGLNGKFPPHIPIGFVKHLEYSSNGLANKIKVESLVHFDTIRYVFVLSQPFFTRPKRHLAKMSSSTQQMFKNRSSASKPSACYITIFILLFLGPYCFTSCHRTLFQMLLFFISRHSCSYG